MAPVLILDNGASSIKAGITNVDSEPRIVSNAVVKQKGGGSKLYIGQEIETCRDYFGLYYRRPFEKGILNDWDVEKAVWDKLLYSDGMNLTTNSMSLLVTEAPFNLPAVAETYDQMVFEEYEFQSYLRCPAAALIPHGDLFSPNGELRPECCIVVDSGFSFTHVVPMINNEVVWEGVKRIDIGGKLLTNYLKETVSFRHWDVMEHTYVMNEIKEACCYISNTFTDDIEACRVHPKKNPIVQEYVFPDYTVNKPGYIRSGPNAAILPEEPSAIVEDQDGAAPPPKLQDDTPVLYMGNERFTVPEVLFHPSDIGLDQRGLAETIATSISTLPEDLRGMFWANIGLVGGNFNLPGIEERLSTELRALAPPEFEIRLRRATNPVTQAYHSALSLVGKGKNSKTFQSYCVTKEEYEESGSNACRRKFNRGAKLHLYSASNMGSENEADRNEESGDTRETAKKGKEDLKEKNSGVARSKSRGGNTKTPAKAAVTRNPSTPVERESELEPEGYESRPGARRRPPRGAMKG